MLLMIIVEENIITIIKLASVTTQILTHRDGAYHDTRQADNSYITTLSSLYYTKTGLNK